MLPSRHRPPPSDATELRFRIGRGRRGSVHRSLTPLPAHGLDLHLQCQDPPAMRGNEVSTLAIRPSAHGKMLLQASGFRSRAASRAVRRGPMVGEALFSWPNFLDFCTRVFSLLFYN